LPRSGKKLKKRPYPQKKSRTRMEIKVNFEDYGGAAKVERHNNTEPNQALQRTNMLVTDRAPSSMLRAKHVRR
jgi:hypothetical protein